MALALGATGFWMYLGVSFTPNAVVICVIVFNAAFGYSWGPLPWLYPPEVRQHSSTSFKMGLCSLLSATLDHATLSASQRCITFYSVSYICIRSVTVTVADVPYSRTNWAFNFLVGELTPYLQEVITWRLYIMHGFFCACSFVIGKTYPYSPI
jgi:hypothetical protein